MVLLLGMWVINPIQVYVEFLGKGLIEIGYFRFWLESYARGKEFPNRSLPTWDHLWFLLYLLLYSLGLALLFLGLAAQIGSGVYWRSGRQIPSGTELHSGPSKALLVAAYVMFPLSLPIFVEALLLVLITAFGSLAVYELLVRRWKIPRFLFGLKIVAPGAPLAAKA